MTSEAQQRAIREAVDHGPILIWGAGAIGGTLGAALVRARHAVVFVDIVEDHVAAIRDPAVGLTIEGPVDPHRISAPAYTPATLKGQFRRVLLCVKAQDTEAACHAIAPHLAPDGYVLSLQNGLCEALITPILGEARTIGCFVNFSADWLAPGRIIYGGRGALVLGELNGEITPRLTALHRMLRDHFEPDAIMTENIWGYLWGKIAYSSMLYTQALGEKGIAHALARPELLPLWRRLGQEAMAVARAEGVTVGSFNGFDPAAFAPDATETSAAASIAAMVEFNRPNAKTHSGIWRDLWVRRRRTPVDAQIAPVLSIAARHGVACPTIARLVAMIHECEAGTRPASDDNLLELMKT